MKNKQMKIRVIFHAYLETETSKHDRSVAYARDPGLNEFWDWLMSTKEDLEKETGRKAIIVSTQIIKS